MARLGRRRFVAGPAAAVAFGLAVPVVPARGAPIGGGRVPLGQLVDAAAARALGARAKLVVPERTAGALSAILWRDLGEPVAGDGSATVRRRIAERMAGEFAAGRTVSVDGWQLSLTEARLCALVAWAGADHVLGPG